MSIQFTTYLRIVPLGLLVIVTCRSAQAAVKALDSASNAAYAAEDDGAWKGVNPSTGENSPGMDNGGTGFLPWSFAGGYHFPDESAYGTLDHFIDGVDFPPSTFNDLGAPAFGLANSNPEATYETAVATRPFAATMGVGDVFTVDFDTPAIYDDPLFDRYPFAIITFRDADGNTVLDMSAGNSAVYGEFPWGYGDLNGKVDLGISPTATSDGSSLSFAVTSLTTGHIIFDGVPFDITFGVADNGEPDHLPVAAGPPASVTFTLFANFSGDGNGNPTGEREFFFNNLKIEGPSTAIPGDFNNSGRVDGDDQLKWKTDFAQGGGSDADGDGDSDGNDILIWQRNLGLPLATAAAAATPEPAGIVLAGVAIAARLLVRRRAAATAHVS